MTWLMQHRTTERVVQGASLVELIANHGGMTWGEDRKCYVNGQFVMHYGESWTPAELERVAARDTLRFLQRQAWRLYKHVDWRTQP